MTIKGSEVTFGVEIEAYVPRSAEYFNVGRYHMGYQLSNSPRGWNGQADGSLSSSYVGYKPVEVVSPVLKGFGYDESNPHADQGLSHLAYMSQILEDSNAKFDHTTGLHIHIGKPQGWTSQHDLALAKVFRQHEQAFLALNGKYVVRRLMTDAYCKASPKWANLVETGTRYRTLNFKTGSKDTVEFRLFQGTADLETLVTAVQMCVAVVVKVANMTNQELGTLVPYPQVRSYQTAVYQFIRSFFTNKTKVVPEARFKEYMQTALGLAQVADNTDTQQVYGSAVTVMRLQRGI